jgi:hypothetical protein
MTLEIQVLALDWHKCFLWSRKESEDIKWVIRSHKLKKDRQYNDLQNTTYTWVKFVIRNTTLPLLKVYK